MASFNELIKNSEVPVLVDFYADWCGPCKMMNPIIKEVATKMDNRLKVIKVNVDKNQKAAQKYGIRGVPTFILFDKGRIVWQKSGAMQENQLIGMLNPHV